MESLAVARVLHGTTAEGPFLRTALWVQGCSIQCPGCINPHLFEPGGPRLDIAELADAIVAAGVEGLTLLGGEPFDQADGCADLAEQVRAAGLGVITFTGYVADDLDTAVAGSPTQRLLASTDLLVDGPYQHQAPDGSRALVGSTNQRFRHHTDRYRFYDPSGSPNRVDIRIAADGETRVAGFLTRAQLKVLNGTSGTAHSN